MSRYLVRPLAEADLAEQARYIAQDSLDSALRFLEAAHDAFERLSSFPALGRRRDFVHSELVDVRSWPISGFEKHLVFYRPLQAGIEVLRILHTARDLGSILGEER